MEFHQRSTNHNWHRFNHTNFLIGQDKPSQLRSLMHDLNQLRVRLVARSMR
jgi:hypothetical protein